MNNKIENEIIPKIKELYSYITDYSTENEDILSSIELFKLSVVEHNLTDSINCLKED